MLSVIYVFSYSVCYYCYYKCSPGLQDKVYDFGQSQRIKSQWEGNSIKRVKKIFGKWSTMKLTQPQTIKI